MGTPIFVGAGPAAYDATTQWPTSLPVSDSTPPGVANGDRVLLFVTAFSASSMSTTCPTPDGWTAVGSRNNSDAVMGSVAMYIFSARWTALTSSASISPTISTSAASYSWRFQCAAWRPSKVVDDFEVTNGGRFTTNADLFFAGVTVSDGLQGSTLIGAQVSPSALSGSGLTSFGYALRADQAPITGRGGGFKVADKSESTNNVFGPYLAWSRGGSPSNFPNSICWHGALDAASDDPSLSSGWSVGRIKY